MEHNISFKKAETTFSVHIRRALTPADRDKQIMIVLYELTNYRKHSYFICIDNTTLFPIGVSIHGATITNLISGFIGTNTCVFMWHTPNITTETSNDYAYGLSFYRQRFFPGNISLLTAVQ